MKGRLSHSDKLFATTRKKIILVIMAVAMLIMILFSGIVMLTYKFVIFRSVNSELEQYKAVEQAVLKNFYDGNTFPSLDIPSQDMPPSMAPSQGMDDIFGGYTDENALRYVRFIFVDNRLIWSTLDGYYDTPISADLTDIEQGVSDFEFRGMDFKGIAVREKNVTIVTGRNVEHEYTALSRLSIALISALVLAFIGVWFVAKFYSKKIIDPIRDAYKKQEYFVQDASHEMRTPLSVIKGKVELMARHPGDQIHEHVDEIYDVISEISAMEKMSNHLIMLTKEDALAASNITEFRLYDMVSEISDELFAMLAETQGKEFVFSVKPQDVVVKWDYEKMKRAFVILIDNAFKYTEQGDKIEISALQIRDDELVIKFYDSGRGIKQSDLPRIFDRFYRSDDVRATDISGSGIGLSMLQLMGSALGFGIKVSSEYGKYTQFVITAPINMK